MDSITAALPIIRPITDMRTKLNEVCAQASETGEPIVLTKNGIASYVLMDAASYEAAERTKRVHLALREVEIEETYRPEPLTAEQADTQIKEIFSLWGVDYA